MTLSVAGPAEQLERGEVVYYPVCPFPLPDGDDRSYLAEQDQGGPVHKNISYDPVRRRLHGHVHRSQEQTDRLLRIFADFSRSLTAWLAGQLPRYAAHWRPDRISYRPLEEATRHLRVNARNDLLHVDAFPTRPTNGQRILRLFVNTNRSEPRVWITGPPFAELLRKFGYEISYEHSLDGSLVERLKEGVARLVKPSRPRRSPYDRFMLRFHDHLKASERMQTGPRKEWSFPPGSCWLAMTDTCSHAVLRGKYALEHSYFIQPESLALPGESPASLLAKAARRPVLLKAA